MRLTAIERKQFVEKEVPEYKGRLNTRNLAILKGSDRLTEYFIKQGYEFYHRRLYIKHSDEEHPITLEDQWYVHCQYKARGLKVVNRSAMLTRHCQNRFIDGKPTVVNVIGVSPTFSDFKEFYDKRFDNKREFLSPIYVEEFQYYPGSAYPRGVNQLHEESTKYLRSVL